MDLETHKLFVSRDVQFAENVFPYASSPADLLEPSHLRDTSDWNWDSYDIGISSPRTDSGGAAPVEDSEGATPVEASDESSISTPVTHSPEQALGRGLRSRQPPPYLRDFVCHSARVVHPSPSLPSTGSSGTRFPLANYVTYQNFSESHTKFLAAISAGVEPRTFHEAVQDPNWRQAMQTEIDALERNGTWVLSDLPPGKKPISCKWVYKLKYNSDGSIERYKARVVVRGDTQVEGIDYDETFAPVAKLVSIRTFLAVAVIKGWEIHQLDVNNAFLHGDLHEDVYMRLPPGFSSSHPNKVCHLRKSLYGLRQSPRNWFAKLATALRRYGFLQSHADHTLFTYCREDTFIVVLVYVDDIIVAGNDSQACKVFKNYLNDCFQLKDLGPLKYFLGIEAARNSSGLFLCQRKYTLDILKEAGLTGAKPAVTPMGQNHKLSSAT